MKEKTSLIPLKLLVISMGILLIGGTIFLFSVIANKANKDTAHASTCANFTVHLGDQGKLISANSDGKTTQLTLAKDEKITLITLDNCTRAVLSTLLIVP